MRKLYQQAKAREDLKKIWQYSYKNFGEKQADKYYDELITGMENLKDNPHIGVSCDYIRSGYRQYQINRHFIFYRLSNKKIHIVRVLHERMEPKRHL
ncbi:MAG: type II toxin-antitoxin system RelE/ParE family toxin [Candidatus Anammoxibacter sp.]